MLKSHLELKGAAQVGKMSQLPISFTLQIFSWSIVDIKVFIISVVKKNLFIMTYSVLFTPSRQDPGSLLVHNEPLTL